MKAYYYNDYNYMERVQMQRSARIARTKQVRKQKALLALGIFITIMIITILSVRKAYANDRTNIDYGTKQYTSVVIYCHDTVDSIAEKYINGPYTSVDDYAKEIKSINHISQNDSLIPGNYLVIPYYSNTRL